MTDDCDLPECPMTAPHTWRSHMDVSGRAAYINMRAEVERLREEQAATQRALTQTAREIRSLEKRIVERDAKVVMAAMRRLGG